MKGWKTRTRIFAGVGAAAIVLTVTVCVLACTQLRIPLRFFDAAEPEVSWNDADADDSASAIVTAVNYTSIGVLICLAFGVGIAWGPRANFAKAKSGCAGSLTTHRLACA
jgi:hypothetical protein